MQKTCKSCVKMLNDTRIPFCRCQISSHMPQQVGLARARETWILWRQDFCHCFPMFPYVSMAKVFSFYVGWQMLSLAHSRVWSMGPTSPVNQLLRTRAGIGNQVWRYGGVIKWGIPKIMGFNTQTVQFWIPLFDETSTIMISIMWRCMWQVAWIFALQDLIEMQIILRCCTIRCLSAFRRLPALGCMLSQLRQSKTP